MNPRTSRLLALLPFVFCLASAGAQTGSTLGSEASAMDRLASSQGAAKVVDKISADFSPFIGADSRAVVTGLRNGTPIALTSAGPGAPQPNQVVIDPPTGKMGFGNVYISLALAEQRAAQLGLSQPVTAEQLGALLVGGSIATPNGTTTTEGILTLRSQNLGWGEIAQRYGFKLGSVMSAMRSANQSLAAATKTAPRGGVTTNSGKTSGSESGIVSGSGRALGRSADKGGAGEGIVSGSGRALGKSTDGHSGTGGGQGIVSGSGRPVGPNPGLVTGRGHAYGVAGAAPAEGGRGKGHNR